MEKRRYCTFRLGSARQALDVAEIREVLRDSRWTPVPLAPATVRGLMNLRGELVTVVDAAALLGTPAADPDTPPRFVLVLADPRAGIGLAVDDVGEILECDASELAPPPATLSRAARPRVRGVHVSEAGLTAVLDLAALLAGAEARHAG